jgi:hypothetical protein
MSIACNHVWQHLARMFVYCVVQDTPIPAFFVMFYGVLETNIRFVLGAMAL